MKIVIINYGAGNLHSVQKSFESANLNLGGTNDIVISSDASELIEADKIVLPGVGSFGDCKQAIMNIDKLFETLVEQIIIKKKPFMGICVGMQLLADKAHEFGEHDGFGWISGEVIKIKQHPEFKIPHMGWNEIKFNAHPLFQNLQSNLDFYFVHSFHFKVLDAKNILATTNYSEPITAAVIKENIFGTQFHPEKSHSNGIKLIENFLQWNPS